MIKKYRNKLIIIFIITVLLTVFQFTLPHQSHLINWYTDFVFKPFQTIRNTIFSIFSFSVGDLLYIIGGFLLTYTFIKWIYYIFTFKTHKHKLALSMLQTLNVIGVFYIVFILGWGGNYYKSSLSDYWKLPKYQAEKKLPLLISFDSFLINKLNQYAPAYHVSSFKKIDQQAQAYYQEYTIHSSKASKAKPSLFGNSMEYLRIQGYYNPFTGEAQVNKNLPTFMLPFVICHEMAHQQGIAAEDDANLLSYTINTLAPNNLFRYSAYFNIWLYTHNSLRMHDSTIANQLKSTLNALTLDHVKQLVALREKYNSDFSEYTGELYDGYLKMHHQNDGIKSYHKVWHSAWALEEKRKKAIIPKIAIP